MLLVGHIFLWDFTRKTSSKQNQMTQKATILIFSVFQLFIIGFIPPIIGQTIKCVGDEYEEDCKYEAWEVSTAPLHERSKDTNLKTVHTPEMWVSFDMAHGGLHGMVFIGNPIKTNDSRWRFRSFAEERKTFAKTLQLSTIHQNTFVLDGTPGACTLNGTANEAIKKFCAEHENKYDMNNSSTSFGEIVELTNGPNGTGERIGFTVQDDIRFGWDGQDLLVKYAGLEVMNGRAAFEPNYWDSKQNLMDGRLSLARKNLSNSESEEAMGEVPPFQLLYQQHRIGFNPISIQLFSDRCTHNFLSCWDEKGNIDGRLYFGQLAPFCSYWRMIDKPKNLDWGVHLSKFTVFTRDDYSQLILHDQLAVIDTTTENIVVPDSQWDLVKKMLKVGHNDPTNCSHALQIVKNLNKFDQLWHLGLPFLRTSCVAMSYEQESILGFGFYGRMWLSGGIPFISSGISIFNQQSIILQILLPFMIYMLQMMRF